MCVYVSSHVTTGSVRCRQEMTHLDAAEILFARGVTKWRRCLNLVIPPGADPGFCNGGGARCIGPMLDHLMSPQAQY